MFEQADHASACSSTRRCRASCSRGAIGGVGIVVLERAPQRLDPGLAELAQGPGGVRPYPPGAVGEAVLERLQGIGGAEGAERLRRLGANRPRLRVEGLDQRRQAGGLADPAEGAGGGDPHLDRVAVQQGGERRGAAGVVGEAERAGETGVELDLAAARGDAGEGVRDGEGPCSSVSRIVSTAQGAPSRSMIRSGGQQPGDEGPDQHLGGARSSGTGEPGAGDEADVGVRVPQQRHDLLDHRRKPGPGQQQRGAGAGRRAAGSESRGQAGDQRRRLHRLADRGDPRRRERRVDRVDRDREVDLGVVAANLVADRGDRGGIAVAKHRLVAGARSARSHLAAIAAELACDGETDERQPQQQARSHQHDETSKGSHRYARYRRCRRPTKACTARPSPSAQVRGGSVRLGPRSFRPPTQGLSLMPRLARRLLTPMILVAAFAAIGILPAAASAAAPSTSSASAATVRADGSASARRRRPRAPRLAGEEGTPAEDRDQPLAGPPGRPTEAGRLRQARCQGARALLRPQGQGTCSASASASIARGAGSKSAARTENVSLRLSTGKRIQQLQLIRSFDIPAGRPVLRTPAQLVLDL